jgi:hypothetical protein
MEINAENMNRPQELPCGLLKMRRRKERGSKKMKVRINEKSERV